MKKTRSCRGALKSDGVSHLFRAQSVLSSEIVQAKTCVNEVSQHSRADPARGRNRGTKGHLRVNHDRSPRPPERVRHPRIQFDRNSSRVVYHGFQVMLERAPDDDLSAHRQLDQLGINVDKNLSRTCLQLRADQKSIDAKALLQ